jgi:signal transduction histidine kinase
MHKLIIDKSGVVLCSSMPNTSCQSCIAKSVHNGFAHSMCPISCESKRLAYQKGNQGEVYICANENITTKNFKLLVAELLYAIPTLRDARLELLSEIKEQSNARVNRVLHNIKNINAHLLQELYTFVPQELFTKRLGKTVNTVVELIKKQPKNAAIAFLRIAKLNSGLKAELSVYDKLLKDNPQLQFREYNIRDVVMLVLHEFFSDFHEIGVYIDVEECYKRVSIDFESFRVALYHIVENASKYVLPNSNIEIKFNSKNDTFSIVFLMQSYKLNVDDKERIFEEGFSGSLAVKAGKSGHGIGMYRAKKLLRLNNGDLIFDPGKVAERIIDNIEYAFNTITITLPIKT